MSDTDNLIARAEAWALHQRYVASMHLPNLPEMAKSYWDRAQLAEDLLAHIATQAAEVARLRAERPGLWEAAEKVASIWSDMQDFDGDKRWHYAAFEEAVERMTTAAIRTLAPPDTEGS